MGKLQVQTHTMTFGITYNDVSQETYEAVYKIKILGTHVMDQILSGTLKTGFLYF